MLNQSSSSWVNLKFHFNFLTLIAFPPFSYFSRAQKWTLPAAAQATCAKYQRGKTEFLQLLPHTHFHSRFTNQSCLWHCFHVSIVIHSHSHVTLHRTALNSYFSPFFLSFLWQVAWLRYSISCHWTEVIQVIIQKEKGRALGGRKLMSG